MSREKAPRCPDDPRCFYCKNRTNKNDRCVNTLCRSYWDECPKCWEKTKEGRCANPLCGSEWLGNVNAPLDYDLAAAIHASKKEAQTKKPAPEEKKHPSRFLQLTDEVKQDGPSEHNHIVRSLSQKEQARQLDPKRAAEVLKLNEDALLKKK